MPNGAFIVRQELALQEAVRGGREDEVKLLLGFKFK